MSPRLGGRQTFDGRPRFETDPCVVSFESQVVNGKRGYFWRCILCGTDGPRMPSPAKLTRAFALHRRGADHRWRAGTA